MGIKVSDILAQARRVFPGTSDQFLFTHLQRVHAYLCGEFGIVVSRMTVDLVNGQQTYTLDPTVAVVIGAEYYTSSSSHGILRAFRTREWDDTRPSWRHASTGAPAYYSVEGNNLLLFPCPNVTSSAGYPCVSIDYWEAPELTINGEIPDSGRTFDAYLYGLLASVASIEVNNNMGTMSRKRGAIIEIWEKYEQKYQQAQDDMDRYYTRRSQASNVILRGDVRLHL